VSAGRLNGKVALITGGSSGIGEAIARVFAREGAKVAVVASSNPAKSEAVAESIRSAGGEASAFVADVRSVEAVEGLVTAVLAAHGTIDILVNSAGVFFPTEIGRTSEADCDRMIDTNLKGLYFAINAVAPVMQRNGSGKIINVASVAAFVGSAKYPLYCAAKAAVVALTRALALQLAPSGIHINAIAPGNTATPINEAIRTAPEFAEQRARIDALTPSRRKFSPPEDIAAGALFLASDESRAMHGATLLLDEGRAAGW
jgi:NAD(P)-dependent dehydrogenase (short-subunit alcohol dehydrogenase family)